MTEQAATLSASDLDILRQWFEAVQDVNPAYLERADFQLAQRLYEALGRRVPASVLRGCLAEAAD